MSENPKLKVIDEEPVTIPKPDEFNLDKFKSKRAAAAANVETLQTGLPYHPISAAKDFVRLHPDEERYWSAEFCFVNVPIKGQKRDTLHLIDEELAMRYLPSGRILRFRLALASKPFDVFFLVTFRHGTKTISGTVATLLLARWQKQTGCRSQAVRRKASRPIKSTSLATPMRSQPRTGQHSR
jgi:hypothetical protein